MTSIKLIVNGARASATTNGILTSGSVGIPVTIQCDSTWDGLTKNLVCASGKGRPTDNSRTIMGIDTTAVVAHEVMTANDRLYLGVEGRNADGTLVIPTLWADCGLIFPGVDDSADPSADPTLPIWAQLQAELQALKGTNTSENTSGLTAAHITALDGMFKVCAFTTADISGEYAAFQTAFGISDPGGNTPAIPDKPDVPDTPDIPDVPDEPDEPEVKVYTVTNNLTHVSNSNSATTASGYYSATLTVHDGCVLNNLSITMGGVDLTDSVYSEGSILITDVTGNIVITATAAQLQKITSTSAYADTVRMYSDNGATMVTTKNYLNGAVTLNATETETTVKVKLTNTTAEGIGCRVYMASAPDWIGELHYVSQEMVTNIPVNGSIEYEYTVKAGYKFAIAGTPASGVQIDMYGAFDVYQPVAEFATKLSYADSIKIYSDGTTGNLLKTSNYQNVIHTTEVFDEETDLIVTLVGGDADVMFAASDWYFGAVNPSAHHSIYYGIKKNTGNTTTLKANQIIKYTHTVQAGYAFAMGAVANNTLTAAMVYVERA